MLRCDALRQSPHTSDRTGADKGTTMLIKKQSEWLQMKKKTYFCMIHEKVTA